MRIAGIVRDSINDGPGMRLVVFTQGCPHQCDGCHNPHTHDPAGGYEITADEIFKHVQINPLCAGITFSGGEPFSQADECAELASRIRAINKDVWCYSGYTLEELQANASCAGFLGCIDVLVDGRFIKARHELKLKWRGSDNQRFWKRTADGLWSEVYFNRWGS